MAHRQTDPRPVRDHRPEWITDFDRIERLIRAAIGERARSVRHVGSTAVADLVAKPVLDIDLAVPDVEDESDYIPRSEAAGFRLIFRYEMAGDPHRQLTLADPNTNLHVWNEDAIELRLHALFLERLRSNDEDRHRYGEGKSAAAAATDDDRYNDRKAAAVYEIHERAFIADPDHRHGPQPLIGDVLVDRFGA